MKGISLRFLTALFVIPTLRQTVMAHAFLDHAEPRVGAKIEQPPEAVKLWFTQAIEPAFSRVEVFDAAGKEVDHKDTHVDPKEPKLLVVTVPQLTPGTYKVHWRVVSIDTHRTQGDFKFVVKP